MFTGFAVGAVGATFGGLAMFLEAGMMHYGLTSMRSANCISGMW